MHILSFYFHANNFWKIYKKNEICFHLTFSFFFMVAIFNHLFKLTLSLLVVT